MLRRVLRPVFAEPLDPPRAGLLAAAVLLAASLVGSCNEAPLAVREFQGPSVALTVASYIQSTATSNSSRTIAVPLAAATTKGNLLVVGFDFTGTTFTSIADNQGNAFTQVGTEATTPGGARMRLYYARNIKGGGETVTINLAASSPYLEVYVGEYAGADTTSPLDVSAQATGSGSSVSSGSAVTTAANDLLVALCIGDNRCSSGSGFTARSTYHSNLLEDRAAVTAGSYAATGGANAGWGIIMAAFRPQSSAPPVPVGSVTVAPATASIIVGTTQALTATTRDASGNMLTGRSISWATSNPAIATVSAAGLVTGVAAGGPVTITATSEGKSGTAAITVTPVPVATVTLAPALASITTGASQTLTATTKDAAGNVLTGRALIWTTSDASIATVSTAGVVTGVAAGGPVTITATSEGKSGTAAITIAPVPVASVTLAPAAATVLVGQTAPLVATVKDAAGTVLTGRVIVWSTNNATVATVSADGVVTGAVAGGPVTITATSEGKSGTAAVTVTLVPVATVTVGPATASVVVGQTLSLSATTKDADGNVLSGRTITWTTGDATLATVSATGVVTGVAGGGPVTITATSQGQSGTAAITVTIPPVASVSVAPLAASVSVGQAAPLVATTKDANGAVLTGRVLTWETSAAAVATVSAGGVVTGVTAGGPVTITATSEGVSGTAAITVTVPVATVTVAPAVASLEAGQTIALTATTNAADGAQLTGRVLAWTTSDPTLATVSATGVVTGVAAGGPVTITATSEGKSGGAAITVTPVPVASVTVAPATATVIVGQSVTFAAAPKDANGTALTGRAITWTTSSPGLASVSPAGVVTGVQAGGPVTITATSEGQSGIAVVTVQALSPTGYLYPLRVGPSSRYLVDQTGKPFFLAGDAAWSLFSQLSDQDADAYLTARQQSGFNLVMVNVIEHKFASNAPRNIYGQAPFTGKNFTTPNEAYFAHVDYMVQSAAQKGIVVLMAPGYLGVACGSEGWGAEIKAATDADMTTWGRFLGARYAGYDNIIWLIGGDTDPRSCGSAPSRLQALVAGIQQFDTRHLFTAHNNSGQMATTTWSGASWLKLNNFYSYSSTLYRAALNAYHVSPTIPFFLIESAYEHTLSSTGQTLRAQSYWTVLSGGFGHVYGNCPVWSFAAPGTSNFCSGSNWKGQLTSQGSKNIQYLQSLFSSRHWYSLVPDESHTAVTAGYGSNTSTSYVTAARASDGSSIIAYLPSSRAVTVNGSSLGGTMTAWWYNPATGAATMIGTFPTSSSRSFTPPASGDWVLVLDNPSFNFPPP